MLTLVFILWFALLLLGFHVGYSLIFVSLFYFFLSGTPQLISFALEQMVEGVNDFILLAVPFFVLTGNLMNGGGITERIFTFAKTLVGHLQGGMAHVNIFASLIFSGMSGSALADAGGLGQLEIKSMRDEGYDDGFAGGVTAASCIIGPLVPPSTSLIIYAVVADQSIERLFIAGFIPGVLTALTLMIMSAFLARRRNYPRGERASLAEIWTSYKRAFCALLTPVIILAGIFSGVFTPTEAAIVAATYSLFIGALVYRELTWKKLFHIILESVKTTGTIFLLVLGVSLFGWIIAREQMPLRVAQAFLAFSENPIILLLSINILLLVLGAIIDALPLLIILVPVLLPTVLAAGVDPVHFGIIVVFNLMIGILTPPMGTALFVVSRVGNIPFHVLTRGVLPFLVPLVITLLLLVFFPQISLFLPGLLR
ncbi:ABC transporter permease [Alkalispirochaeta sphaeroplastigenens]|uniref:ABC transporter permease n=1 Tax=Alkalispirochaeta sphaeroplastigenens TaxID=1187066 RepID=A0A2S4JKF9_9SPIO|nr:TRAP transporter large permease [Alkalispirochaeta sphaeroplastigenens]POR00005.1 ABC transporter permease [Alkalispirochaeta sphaeroplastigenens]